MRSFLDSRQGRSFEVTLAVRPSVCRSVTNIFHNLFTSFSWNSAESDFLEVFLFTLEEVKRAQNGLKIDFLLFMKFLLEVA